MNNCTFIGNVSQNLELKQYSRKDQTGVVSILEFNLAVSKGGTDAGANFIRIKAFGKLAENIAKFCVKGTKLSVSGSLETERWEDKDGKVRYGYSIHVKEVEFLDSKAVTDARRNQFANQQMQTNQAPAYAYQAYPNNANTMNRATPAYVQPAPNYAGNPQTNYNTNYNYAPNHSLDHMPY